MFWGAGFSFVVKFAHRCCDVLLTTGKKQISEAVYIDYL